MANNAHITLVGTVLQDPTSRQVKNSTVLSLRVAVKTTKKQPNNDWPASDIYDVAVWGKTGDALVGKVKTKTKVWVTGDFMLGEEWQDRQGNTHQSLRVNANHVEVIGGGNYTGNSNNNKPAAVETEEEPPF